MPTDLQVFQLELERVRLRAAMATERLSGQPDEATLDRARAELTTIEAALAESRHAGRAHELVVQLGLEPDDVELLWNAVGATMDPRTVPHLLVLAGAEGRRGLSLLVHALIAEHDPERARSLAVRITEAHPLLRDHLLEWNGDAQSAIAARPFIAAKRTITWLAGGDEIDDAMLGAGSVVDVPDLLELDPRQRATQARLADVLFGSPSPLVVIEGAGGTGRRTAIASVAASRGRAVIALDLKRVPRGMPALETALVGLRRECRLRDAIPLIANADELAGEANDPTMARRVLSRLLDDIPGPIAATASPQSLEVELDRPLVRVHWNLPDVTTRRAIWKHVLGDDDTAEIAQAVDGIAMRYGLGAGGIRRAAASARLGAGNGPIGAHHLVDGVRTNIAERLGDLALRQEIKQTWKDLVLAPDILDQVKMLVARVRHAHRVLDDWGFSSKLAKGTGVAALFSGPPGTGKTMVAGLIASELDLELYQVDLSKVVSKWVGETEKQLAKIFEAAEAGHALLLFDEADALFAKRTDVKSAVDRYANLEVNYLLQRIESFGGVSILTTNLDASIDPALRRRLAANVAFWPPEEIERQELWRRMLESRAPLARDIDISELARTFDEMTGANIRNAVLAAAFLASAEDGPITHARLERAGRAEYASMGRVLGRK
ncbi:MAG TPA: ATP-binding protein [Kofleriaceae bacterium]